MKHSIALTLLLGITLSFGCAERSDLLVIRDVTVIDGTGTGAQPGMSVVIEQGRISAVGTEESVSYPSSARVIDGTGKYLIPGLWDMHVHLRDLDGTLPLFVVNGVTTIRDMGSNLEETVALREQVEAGTLIGPRIKTSGEMVESSSWLGQYVDLMREEGADEEAIEEFLSTRVTVGDVQEAGEVVRSLLDRGADFIKIRHAESPEVFAAIAEAAEAAGTHLAGHYVWIMSLEDSAISGQKSFEHNILPGFNERDSEQKAAIFEVLVQHDAHIVPTLVTNEMETVPLERAGAIARDTEGAIDSRNRYVSPSIRVDWVETVAFNAADEERPPPEVIQQMIAGSNEFLVQARDAGVKMMAGTDAPTTGVFLGFSLHDELALLVETYGMTPMEAIRSATAIPAAFMGMDADVGTIEPGKRADLILLDANPLEDVNNTRLIDIVIVNGRVHDRSAREQLLNEIEASIASSGDVES
jgi:imidazolonepropionase-like amidohydrolase